MVSVLASSAVDHGFESPGRVKPKTIKLVFVASLCQDITEIMLKVVLNTITLTLKLSYNVLGLEHKWHNTCINSSHFI